MARHEPLAHDDRPRIRHRRGVREPVSYGEEVKPGHGMTAIAFVKRASVETAAVLSALAVAAGLIFGSAVGIGVVAGGALALVNLWWLARRAVAATEAPVSNWSLGSVLRLGGVA